MPWIDAFAPAIAAQRSAVIADTWGHLAPERNRRYPGRVVFAVGCYDSCNPVILASHFAGLDDSPWLYEHLTDFVQGLVSDNRDERAGHVYEWTGTVRNYKFSGKVKLLADTSASRTRK